jgi:hypothetical protein
MKSSLIIKEEEMKKMASLLVLLLLTSFLQAQTPLVKQWDRRFGGENWDNLFSFIQTKEGGYLLNGSTYSDSSGDVSQPMFVYGYGDMWIVKADGNGNKQWDRRYGGFDTEESTAATQTRDGGYILGGYSHSGIGGDKTQDNWDTTYLSNDFWIVKIDSGGNVQWDKRFGGFYVDVLYSLQQTADGGYILGGDSYSGIGGDKTEDNWDTTYATADYWMVKIDSMGNKQWDKRFGGTDDDFFVSLQQTTDGGYILGGTSISEASGDKTQDNWLGYSDFWIVKTDSAGNKEWDKRIGGTADDFLGSLQETRDGGFILGGVSFSGIGGDKTKPMLDTTLFNGRDFWIIKIDALGVRQWDKKYGGLAAEDDFESISQTYDGGFLLAGTSYSPIGGDKSENNLGQEQIWVIKTDSIGIKQWDKTVLTRPFIDEEFGIAIQTADGCYLMATYTTADTGGHKTQANWDPSLSTEDFWIVKFCDTSQAPMPLQANTSANSPNCADTCSGSAVVTPLHGTPPYTFHWQPSNDSTSNINNLCPGNYLVTVTDASGASVTDAITINAPSSPTVQIVVTDSVLCASDSTLVCASSGFNTYIWNTGLTTPCIYARLAGNYYVTVTDNNNCTAESNHLAVTVYPLPPVSISVNGDTLTAYNAVTYQWYLNNSMINGAFSSVYIAHQAGSYTVAVTDTNGCRAVSSAVIISGLQRLTEIELSIYPNPATHELFILGSFKTEQVSIYNVDGKLVSQTKTPANNRIDISDLAAGVYIAEVKVRDLIARVRWVKM